MYKTKFPDWEVATNDVGTYDGIMAYSYAKRAQVLLAEQWTVEFPAIKFVSTHPGWAASAGVSAAFTEEQISYLEPLRTQWEGAEAICWLCVVASSEIEGGAFYLDRQPCTKHVGGAFFSEGSQTKNTPGEVRDMMLRLQKWATLDSKLLQTEREKDIKAYNAKQQPDTLPPLAPTSKLIDINRFMGKWHVISCIPSMFEKTAHNPTETYTLLEDGSIDIKYSYNDKAFSGPFKTLPQKGFIAEDSKTKSAWKMQPFWPVKLDYFILEVADDYSTTVVGHPSRGYIWIMARTPSISDVVYSAILERVRRNYLYNISEIKMCPQQPNHYVSMKEAELRT